MKRRNWMFKSRIGMILSLFIFYSLFNYFTAVPLQAARKKGIVLRGSKTIISKKKEIELKVGGKRVNLDFLVGGKNITKGVRWKSEDRSIVKISKKGVMKGLKEGRAKVTAKYKGKQYQIQVRVKSDNSNAGITAQQIGYNKISINGTNLSSNSSDYQLMQDEEVLGIKKLEPNISKTEIVITLKEELIEDELQIEYAGTVIRLQANEERVERVSLLDETIQVENNNGMNQSYVSFEVKNQFGEDALSRMDGFEAESSNGYAAIDEEQGRILLSGLTNTGNANQIKITLKYDDETNERKWEFYVRGGEQKGDSFEDESTTELIPTFVY